MNANLFSLSYYTYVNLNFDQNSYKDSLELDFSSIYIQVCIYAVYVSKFFQFSLLNASVDESHFAIIPVA